MLGPRFQIAVEFSSDSPFSRARLNEAEQLLHTDLQTGLLCAHESAGPGARLLIVTSAPDECAGEIRRHLEPLGRTARRAAPGSWPPDPPDRLLPSAGWCQVEITLVPHGE